ncbi:MAG: hypothetical protein HLUCCA05_07405 [Roseibaca calidilacus]|uniref:SWIM-type domain-containing protein n=1 Tax=Roseibaca calidilacus TaxID=1666912 RepID=A0A0P7W794_9RHOB|nr:MAG: hypothetical protein HLUCCA05_07405 [Roseibaca calidilacus]CUX81088.1 hypothetical protein Ga0058931_1526 [Roseibaca calidilacus]
MLRFQVQGSGKAPHSITAEGEGPDFRIFCSCPAGRKGGMFCKQVAALLVGDVTKLIGPTGEMAELARRASGSPRIYP